MAVDRVAGPIYWSINLKSFHSGFPPAKARGYIYTMHTIESLYSIPRYREIDVTLREVWLREEGRKLRLIYEGGTLTDCFDDEIEPKEKIKDDIEEDICSLDMKILKERGTDIEFLSPNDFSPKNIAHWFTSPNELRRRCIRVRNRTRSQALSQNGQP